MKKMRESFTKVLAQMLVLAMCLTMMPMAKVNVKAADDALIDKDKTGSITVTKYATVKTATTTSTAPGTIGAGTGIEATSPVTTTGYTPLAGAVFNLYQIADKTATLAYYNGKAATTTSTSTTTITEYKIGTGGYTYTDGVAKYGETTLTAVATGTTAATSGTVTFSALPVGIYVLQEVSANGQITAPLCAPCIISIPMVNTDTSNNNGNAKWIYDVKVFPKNHEAVGNVEITKQDQNAAAISGVVFKLSGKKFTNDTRTTLDASWSEVTKYVDDAGTEHTYSFTTGTDGKLKIENLPANLYGTQYKLEEVSAPAGYIVNKTPMYFKVLPNNTIVWNTDTTGDFQNKSTAVIGTPTVATTAPTVLPIKIENPSVSMTKQVQENKATTPGWKQDEQYGMDDIITYRITAYVPKNVKEIAYSIEDTLDAGLSFIEVKSVKYADTAEGCAATTATTVAAGHYTVTKKASDGGFTFQFTDSVDDEKGNFIQITYTAKMNANAVVASSTTTGGNKNTAKLTCLQSIGDTTATPTYYTISDEARVFTYQYLITKRKDTATGDAAGAVEFQLLDASKNVMNVVFVSKGVYRLALNGETSGTTQTLVTSSDTTNLGTIRIKGLENGTYYLKETKTIDGYNLLSDNYEITVNVTETTTWNTETATTAFSSTGAKVDRTWTSTAYSGGSTTAEPAVTEATIINKKGFVLPQTGSMGYLLFCVAGILLVLGGAVLMFSGRKKTIR